jgi:hypothetical protein
MYNKIRIRKDFRSIHEAHWWARDNLGIDKYEAKKLMIIGGKRVWDEPSKKL